MIGRSDGDLQRLFRGLREADRRDAPSFEASVRHARGVPPVRRAAGWRSVALAAAAVVVAALALTVVLRNAPTGHEALAAELLRQAEGILSFDAPTDTFYAMPELECLYEGPSLELTSIELPELTSGERNGT